MPTILVADDNSNIQKMVTLAFKGEGINVVAVGNGEAAVKKSIEIVPDLVLADIFMPVRSGYEVCEFLKQDPRFSHIPVVLLAGAFDPFDEREAQRVGADGVLKKPFVPPDPLVALVKGLLAKNAEKLVAVAVPVQTAAVSTQNSTQESTASASSTPAISSTPFVPPPFPSPSPDPSMKADEYPDDDMELGTAAPPMRDFSISTVPVEPARAGGADAFGSMLDTSPLGTMMPPMRKLTEPVTDETVGEDREIQPASAHTAFEGFSPWRASASSAGVVEEEAPPQSTEPANQFTDSPKDLMGRVWEIDPNSDKSPEETIIESDDDISPLTHSAQHVTNVRSEASAAVETPEAAATDTASAVETSETEPSENSRVSDWRSAFKQSPEEAAQIVESPLQSTSPWKIPGTPVETLLSDRAVEAEGAQEVEAANEVASSSEILSAAEVEAPAEPVAEFVAEPEAITETVSSDASTPSVEFESEIHEPFAAEAESETDNTSHSAQVSQLEVAEDRGHHEASVSASEESIPASASAQTETSDWIAALPAHLSPEDTTTIARSVVEQLAPSAVESIASSFPVPTAAPSDPRVVEEIVARVVERMQPQILEMITREVLRPVVEALVRRQLEQKLPE